MSIKKAGIGLLLFIGLLLAGLRINNHFVRNKYLVDLDHNKLSEKENQMVKDVHLLLKNANDFWPGMGDMEIPIVLYNDQYEFLIGSEIPDSSWTLIDSISLHPYYISYKMAEHPQSFGVKRNGKWAGSLATCQKMNKEMIGNIDRELPPFISKFLPYNLFDISDDYHVVLYIHEAFHAFQGNKNERKLTEAMNAYEYEASYPYEQEGQIFGWNEEGALLRKALEEKSVDKLKEIVYMWVEKRQERRADGKLSAKHIDYEKQLEWLEGVAFYTEIKAYRTASRMRNLGFTYTKNPSYWDDEMNNLKNKLGLMEGDLRFYLSGMAQAVILDNLSSNWKENSMQDGIYLEDIIMETINIFLELPKLETEKTQ